MSAIVDELKALYTAGAFESCRQKARAALTGGNTEASTFLFYALSLARLGQWPAMADLVRGAGPQAVQLVTWMCSELMKGRAYETVSAVDRAFAPHEPYWLIATYFAGCALMMQDRLPAALARFKAFRLAWPHFHGKIDFLGNDGMNVMLRQGRLVADPEEVARRLALPIGLPNLTFAGAAPNGATPAVSASGNNHYFNTMGPGFVAGMMAMLPEGTMLHLHVIDPDAQSHALIEQLSAAHGARVVFSLETEPLSRTYTYYACSRFYVMTALLDRYRAPIVSFDIDIVPTQPVSPLFETAAPFDFCCFRTGRDEPASVYQASIMYWAARPATRALLDGLQHFCWEELRNPSRTSWMLDQAALFSLLSDPARAPQFGDYNTLIGRTLDDVVRVTHSEPVKRELRHRVQKDEPTELILGGAGQRG